MILRHRSSQPSIHRAILLRFIIVGGVNTIFGYSLYALFMYFHLHYTVSVFLATTLGVLFNFKTLGKLVFNNDDNVLIFRFIGVYAVIYLFNVAALRIFDFYKVDLYIAGLLLLVPVAALSFYLNKKIVFAIKGEKR